MFDGEKVERILHVLYFYDLIPQDDYGENAPKHYPSLYTTWCGMNLCEQPGQTRCSADLHWGILVIS